MKISIVIPSYNEENNVGPLYNQIRQSLEGFNYECIFVDDGSKDSTFANIKKLALADNRVKGLSFSRNFGHQIALLAGLAECDGDVAITMDADGQHPPELIPKLISKFKEGNHIVNTKRLATKDAGWFKNVTSSWFYKLINSMSNVRVEPASSDFRLMSRQAVDAFLQLPEKDRFTRGLVGWMGFRQAVVEFVAPARMSGETKYTLKKMIRFAWDGITSFSSKPLKISMVLGMLAILFGVFYSIFAFVSFVTEKAVPGWTSTMLVILFLGGFQLLSLGIIGEYIARIFNESKNRPHYFIQDRC